MKNFKDYLSEQTSPESVLENAKNVIAKHLTGSRHGQFIDHMNVLIAGARDKEIYNAAYSEAYSYGLSRGLEYAWDAVRNKNWNSEFDDRMKTEHKDLFWDLYSFSGPNSIAKFARTWDKVRNVPNEIKEFISAIKNVPAAIKELKSYVKKGRPPAAPKPGSFVKPMASREASKMAVGFLDEAARSFKERLLASVEADLIATLTQLRHINTITDLKKAPERVKQLASSVAILKRINDEVVIRTDAEAVTRKIAANYVSSIIEGFIAKNTKKLELIFEKKGKPTSHRIVRTNIRNQILENEMYFGFADGSSFDIYSSVVYKSTNMGRLYLQFPTRFTNVKLADGTKMKMPSEEKMIKEF